MVISIGTPILSGLLPSIHPSSAPATTTSGRTQRSCSFPGHPGDTSFLPRCGSLCNISQQNSLASLNLSFLKPLPSQFAFNLSQSIISMLPFPEKEMVSASARLTLRATLKIAVSFPVKPSLMSLLIASSAF